MESAEVLSTSSVQSTESKVMALSSDLVSFDDFYLECRQIASEKRNGIYFINHDSIVFYNWGTYPFRVRYDYKNIYNTFLSGTDLYVLSEDSTDATKMQYTVIDLNNGALVKEKKGLSGSTSAIGVDATGRIFLADAEYMHVLDANGNTLSKTAITDSIYDIVYIDLKTNTIYFTGYANWVYWGYDHDMCVVKKGTISGNTVTLEEDVIVELLNQLYFYDRKHPIEVLNDEYFYEESVYYGGSFLSEIKDYPESVLLGFKQTYNNEYEASGTRGVYWAKRDALISYVGNNTVKAVGIESGKELYSITSKYPVFSMMLMGETLLLVEKENDQFYLEEIALKESTKLQINGAKDIKVKESVQLSVTSDGNLKDELSWSSSDSTVASVDSNGKVFGWHPGTATITVKNSNGISAQCKINVTKQASEVTKKTIVSLPASDHYNKDFNDYYMWSSPMESFLMENGDGSFSRIEFYDGYVVIDTFSESGSKKSTKKIKAELPIFGGFFAGETYNFLVYGKKNENETDSTEVMRVVKYSKDWTRLGYGSVYGANTYIPFEAGCLRMDEKDGVLYIHTCHEMYQSEDGYHHQANMTYEFDQKTMKEKQSWYDVMNISYGYVSHSFNQFIKVDDSYVYRVDHGDAYPRGVALTRYKIGDDLTNVEYTTLKPFPGMTGDNLTGASIGGFELSDDNCLIVGSSVPFNENASTHDI